MSIALDVHMIDRRRGRARLEDGRTQRVVAMGDHRGRPCSAIVASHAVALDDDGGAYVVDALRMTARPLGRVASWILGVGVVAG